MKSTDKIFFSLLAIFLIVVFFPNSSNSTNRIKADEEIKIGRIDTHIHLYDTRREGSVAFLDPGKNEKIYFPHLTNEFVGTAGPAGIDYAIVVEASKRREDNEWLMQLVNSSSELLGCILNLDPRHPEFKVDIERYLKFEKFRGMRIRPKTPIDLSSPRVVESLGILEKHDLVLELGHDQKTMDDIVALATKYPNLTIIINHLAGGRLKDGVVTPANWKDSVGKLAEKSNIVCKVSMIYNLSGQDPAPTNMDYYKPLIDPVVNAFGSDRVMFGSNWTLSEMRGKYADMVKIFDAYCRYNEMLTPEQFYYENAVKIYGLKIH